MAWMGIYLPLSEEYEYVAYLYELNTPMGTRYYFSNTYKGTKETGPISANVIMETLLLELERAFSSTKLVGMVHTHPKPQQHPVYTLHNDLQSTDPGLAGGDRWIFTLLNLPEMFIIPYQRCNGVPQIIVYSDSSTWCPN